MGQDLTSCCCAAPMKIELNTMSQGTSPGYQVEDEYHSNMNWITLIQAHWKGKVQRMRYEKLRDECRRKATHFLTQDQLETIDKRRLISLFLLFDSNEAELASQLNESQYRYRTSGALYEGQWLGGFRHGRGKMHFSDGATYEGAWYLGRAQGYGKFTKVKGEMYEGEWANDLYHGKGLSSHVNNFQFEGEFKKGIQEGVGSERWPDGSLFFGNYVNGKRNGYGVQKWPDNQSYAGDYKEGLIEGFGTYRWTDGREFTGDWRNQKIYGFGVQTYANGRRYEGFYKLDKRQGYGIYMMPDQSSYSGSWLEGKQHGYGCVMNARDELKYGVWNRGTKFVKLTTNQATDIQNEDLDLSDAPQVQMQLGEDKLPFFNEISVLANRFKPFDNFATEQAIFELNKCTQMENSERLYGQLNEMQICV